MSALKFDQYRAHYELIKNPYTSIIYTDNVDMTHQTNFDYTQTDLTAPPIKGISDFITTFQQTNVCVKLLNFKHWKNFK